MGYIYKIKNKIDNKIYIGQTTQDLETRWKGHRKNSSNCRYLKSALKKYGVENFDFQLVCITFDNQLDDMEIKYIEQYNCLVPNGYNIRLGGNSGKHHEDTKRKIAETLKTKHKNGLIPLMPHLTNQPNEVTKKKISETLKGCKKTQDSIDKGNITKINQRNMKIIQYDIHGNRLKSFDTCKEAAEYIGVASSSITRCCIGKYKTSKGYVWKYESITSKNMKIIQYDIQGNRLNTFNSLKEASEYIGITRSCIGHCCNGRIRTSKGYVWKYESIL